MGPLTYFATEANGELWSPDGKNILFTSAVYPDCDGDSLKDRDSNKKKVVASRIKSQSAHYRPCSIVTGMHTRTAVAVTSL